MAGQGVQIDILEAGTRVGLAELLGECVQFGEILQGLGARTEAQRVVAAESLGGVPVLARPQRPQGGVENGDLLGDAGIAECLPDQLGQFGLLLGGHRVQHALRRGGPGGERVDQLVGITRILREEFAVLGHEFGELRFDVLAPCMCREKVVQVGQHPSHALDVLGGGVLQGLFHALEPGFEQFLTEQVPDLLVVLPSGFGSPLVLGQFADRGRGARR